MPYPSEKTQKLVKIQNDNFEACGQCDRKVVSIKPDFLSEPMLNEQPLKECHCTDFYSRIPGKDARGDLENLILQDLSSEQPKREKIIITHIGVKPHSAEMYILIAKLINAGFHYITLHAADLVNKKYDEAFLSALATLWASLYFVSSKTIQTRKTYPESNHFEIEEILEDHSDTLHLELYIHNNAANIQYPNEQKPTIILYEDVGNLDPVIPVLPSSVAENAKYYQIKIKNECPQWSAYREIWKISNKTKLWQVEKKERIASGELTYPSSPC